MSSIRLPAYLLTALAIVVAATAGAGPIYKWVDAKGVTHYGEKAPDGAQTSQVKVSDTTSSDAEDEIAQLNKQRASQEEARKKAEGGETTTSTSEQERTNAACDQVRKNLDVLRTGKQVRMAGDDGQQRQLSADQVAEQLKFAEQEVQRCEEVQRLQQSTNSAPVAPRR